MNVEALAFGAARFLTAGKSADIFNPTLRSGTPS